MKAIKRKILYPVLKLYSPNKQPLAILSNKNVNLAYEIVKKSILNDVTTLTFKIPFDNTIISYDSAEMLVKFENDFYIIKTVELSDTDSNTLSITCESEFTEIKGIRCQALTLDNASGKTPKELFDIIITSPLNVDLTRLYKWGGTDITETYRYIEAESGTSVFENLLTLCEKFDGWMELTTDSDGQKWVYLRKNAIDNGKFIRKGQGLKSLDITYDSTGIFTRLHAYGASDEDTTNPINITSVNPTGKLYVEDISWFKAKGMTTEEIYVTPRCVQETDYTDTNIIDVNTLYQTALEQLKKVSLPVLSGKISMSDFSVYEDSSLTEPVVGEQVIIIDKDIDFNLTAQIESVERKYTENPFDVTVELTNVIKYSSILKDLQTSSDIVNKVTTTTTNGTPAINTASLTGNIDASLIKTGILKSINDYFLLNLTDGTFNFLNKLYSNNGLINVPTLPTTTSDKQIANTEFVTNKLNERQNVIVDTITTTITSGTSNITLNITGLGMNPIIITNGDYSLNQAQILGVKNVSTDVVTVYYSNAIDGNCKFNFTYKTN